MNVLRCRPAGRVLAAVAALATLARPVVAEDRARTWLGLGFGGGGGRGGEGLVLTATLVHQRREHYFAVRALGLADPFDEASDSSTELAFLYGRAATRRYGHAALATGLAAVFPEFCGRSGTSGCATIGVPVVAEVAVQPLPILGLGVQAFASLNTRGSFAGVTVFVQVGWMP